LKSVNSLF